MSIDISLNSIAIESNSIITVTFPYNVSNSSSSSVALNSSNFKLTISDACDISNINITSISGSGQTYEINFNLSGGTAYGNERITVGNGNSAIYNTSGDSIKIVNNNSILLNKKNAPVITNTFFATADNTKLAVVFSEPVYANLDANNPITTLDLSVSVTNETLNDFNIPLSNVVKITDIMYYINIDISIITLDGNEVFTINPTTIFDAYGNEMSTSQQNNTARLLPFITNVTINANYDEIAVTFSEIIMSTASTDFTLSISTTDINTGDITLSNLSPDSFEPYTLLTFNDISSNITQSEQTGLDAMTDADLIEDEQERLVNIANFNADKIYTFIFSSSQMPPNGTNGTETIIVNPSSDNLIFNEYGEFALKHQLNNTIILNLAIIGLTINYDNTELIVTFSKPVYGDAGGTALISSNFIINITGTGSSSPTIISVSNISDSKYKIIIVPPTPTDSTSSITVTMNNDVYDGSDIVTPLYYNNSVSMNYDNLSVPDVSTMTVNDTNSELTVTFSRCI